MNKRKEQKEQSYTAVLESASRFIRKKGMANMSVNEVMADAGLTVGGFYSHFKNKDELIELSFKNSMVQVAELMQKAVTENNKANPLQAVISYYLSKEHCESSSVGCPLPTVLGEAAFTELKPKTRRLFSEALLTMKSRLLGVAKNNTNEEEVFALMALMIGGQIIARATKGTEVSDQILDSCKKWAKKNCSVGTQ